MTHTVTLSDRDIVFIDTALNVLATAAMLVKEEWRSVDLDALEELSAEFTKLRKSDQRLRAQNNAAHHHRR